MLDRAGIQRLIPHQGAMCLLDRVVSWSAGEIHCESRSHLDPATPLRRQGRLGAIAGIEYGLQAAALHGALRSQAPQPPGLLAALRSVALHVPFLDDPAIGMLRIEAMLTHGDSRAMIYEFRLCAGDRGLLVRGRATIALMQDTG